MREGHVYRPFAVRERRGQWSRLEIDVADDPDPIFGIKPPCLDRDVRERKMLAEETLHRWLFCLRDDPPCAVVEKAVDHDAIIAEHRLHKTGCRPHHGVELCYTVDTADQGLGETQSQL